MTHLAFVIQRFINSEPMYWDGGRNTFVKDSSEAVRFVRRRDAERVLSCICHGNGRVEEMGWKMTTLAPDTIMRPTTGEL